MTCETCPIVVRKKPCNAAGREFGNCDFVLKTATVIDPDR